MWIAFMIWSLCTVIFLVIGIISFRSEKPAGFFAGVNPPEVKDVKKYNHTVGMIWFIGSGIFELIGVPFLFGKQNSPIFIIVLVGTVFWSIGMMISYVLITAKYTKR